MKTRIAGRLTIGVAAAATLITIAFSSATAGPVHPWPMFGHERLHTSKVAISGTTTNHIKWTFALGSSVDNNASPVVAADGTIYIGTSKSLFAINPNGTLKWKKYGTAFDDIDSDSAPAIGAAAVYFVRDLPSSDPNWPGSALTALNPADGAHLWSYPIYHTTYGSPTIGSDGTIYVAGGRTSGDNSGTLYAIRPNGTLKWKYEPTGTGSSAWIETSPAVTDTAVYFVHNSFGLVRISTANVFQWQALGGTCCWNQPTVGPNGIVLLGTGSMDFRAINPNGTPKWSIPVSSTMYSSATATDGTSAYRGDNGGNFYGFNLGTHTIKWKKTVTGGPIQSTPALATGNGLVYFTQENGYIWARKTLDGTLQWKRFIGSSDSSPALGADGTVYAASTAGTLYAFK